MRRRVATADELERAIRYRGLDGARAALARYGLVPPIAGLSGIAVDASTPAPTQTAGTVSGSMTSASFSPPSDSLILIGIAGGNPAVGTEMVSSMSDNLGTHLTWTEFGFEDVSRDTYASLWWAYTTSAQTSMTVTATILTNAFAQGATLVPVVLTGAGSTQTATVVKASHPSGSAVATITVTGTANGSQVFMMHADFGPGSAPTVPGGQTISFNGHSSSYVTSGNNYYMESTTAPTSGGSVTLNATAPSCSNWSEVAIEIQAAGAASPGPNPAMVNWPQAMWRSAYR